MMRPDTPPLHTYGCLTHRIRVADPDRDTAWDLIGPHLRSGRWWWRPTGCAIVYACIEHVHRTCNGCGHDLGDLTKWEVHLAWSARPLPDARDECPNCHVEAEPDDGVSERPRAGVVEHVIEVSPGQFEVVDTTPVRYVPGGAPGVFMVVDADGGLLQARRGDRLVADVLGPGQTIKVKINLEGQDDSP